MTAQGAVGFMAGTLRGRDTCGGGLWLWFGMQIARQKGKLAGSPQIHAGTVGQIRAASRKA